MANIKLHVGNNDGGCKEKSEGEIYKQFRDKVFGYLLNRTGRIEDAEDLCSEVFLKVYSHLDSFDDKKASLSTWIFNITRNTLFDHYRTSHPTEELDDFAMSKNISESAEDEVCNNESLEELASALEKLPERNRDIMIMRYYKKMTLKEIAEKLDISYSYAKVLHNNALETMKKLLKR